MTFVNTEGVVCVQIAEIRRFFPTSHQMNTALATTTTLVAEVALALHPILIKQLGTTLPTQLLSRLGVYTILGLSLASAQERTWTWGSKRAALASIGLGAMNLVHIASSYLSYELLPAGSALALFYTYPFFNILAGVLFLGDTLDTRILPLMAMAFAGVLLIAKYTHNGEETDDQKKEKEDRFKGYGTITTGVIASMVSALTETMIFLVAKTAEEPSPYLAILRLYPAAFAGLLGWIVLSGTEAVRTAFGSTIFFHREPISTDLKGVWIPMLLFNVFIGFLGYSLRFFSIPRLPTAIFSILTFVGVAAGYGWGLAYAKEVPSAGALAGAGLITGALGILRFVS